MDIDKDLKFGSNASADLKLSSSNIIKGDWDAFSSSGCKWTIIGYEFTVETWTRAPIFCQKPNYRFYESDIIQNQVKDLLKNGWIRP